ncbi:restriction endonuclease subunit S [Pedobacter frigidisoli]|uniref:Restriction endonuclease subunit S n=1 Tax=Pedobacter frigidisoli TaxID=2530455 RepID=A0A4R0P275_9SPHI|nr:restriction endonuclease subunit S [Pedobacter frigidisoli]TCD10580.1 restriction endonuclease subunit S [Pedobacter frigidisoli]
MNWEKVWLNEVSEVSAGQSAPKDPCFTINDGLPFIRAGHLLELTNGKDLSELPTINEVNAKACRLKILKKGSVIFAKSGMSATLNRIYKLEEDSFYVSHLASVTPNLNFLDSAYCSYFLFYFNPSQLIKDSAYPSIGLSDISKIEIPLPPLPIQKQIAEILDKTDVLRKKDLALLKHYDALAQSLFIDMFGDPVRNEKGWNNEELKKLCLKITDGTHFSPPNHLSGRPYITAKHVRKNLVDFYSNPTFISEEDHLGIYSRCNPKKDDVLYIKDGATTGVAAVNNYEFEFSMLSSLALIKPNLQLINEQYLCYWLNNEYVKENYIRNYMAGAAIRRFTLAKINKFKILAPPIALQNQFAVQIKNIELQKEKVKAQIKASENLFQALLQKMFR